jgi:hypothetical protein
VIIIQASVGVVAVIGGATESEAVLVGVAEAVVAEASES